MPEPAARKPARTSSAATDFSVALLCSLVRAGVRHIVLSPGSRSQALALVAAELERVGAVRLHVRIDERVAGFTCLGIAVETGVPAAVITTSGTATANLHPAVMEAHASGVPMILLSADRPDELRDIRANQTADQVGVYGSAVAWMRDVPAPSGADDEDALAAELAREAWEAATGTGWAGRGSGGIPTPGPIHLNLAFREPLSAPVPDLGGLQLARATGARSRTTLGGDGPEVPGGRVEIEITGAARTLVIAGHGAGEAAEELAHRGGWPLVAEVSSGSRFGPNLVVAYRELLRDPEFGGRVERVIVFGHPTLSREVPMLLERDDVESIVVAPTGLEYYNPGHRSRAVASVRVAARGERNTAEPNTGEPNTAERNTPEAREWRGRWIAASRALTDRGPASVSATGAPDVDAGRSSDPADRLAFARQELAAVREPITRAMLADALWRFTWPHDRLVVAASRLIRDLDRVVGGKKIHVHANRGLAGIDGTIATAVGIALAQADTEADTGRPLGTTRVLLGDLALAHDVGSLALGGGTPQADAEDRPRIQVIVGNDGGGTIFDALEVASSASRSALDRVLLTPQRIDIEALAAAFGWSFTRATTRGELDQALSAPPGGSSIVEVPLPR